MRGDSRERLSRVAVHLHVHPGSGIGAWKCPCTESSSGPVFHPIDIVQNFYDTFIPRTATPAGPLLTQTIVGRMEFKTARDPSVPAPITTRARPVRPLTAATGWAAAPRYQTLVGSIAGAT